MKLDSNWTRGDKGLGKPLITLRDLSKEVGASVKSIVGIMRHRPNHPTPRIHHTKNRAHTSYYDAEQLRDWWKSIKQENTK